MASRCVFKNIVALGWGVALILSFSSAQADVKKEKLEIQEATADNQSSKRSGLERTRMIRQNLVQDTNLSINAQNIKIITIKGKVILDGLVNSKSEKARVEELARAAAGTAQIESKLKIKQ